MRKEYQKPALYAERFELLEHISSSCPALNSEPGWVTHREKGDCGFRIDGPYTDTNILFYGSDPCNIDADDFEDGFLPEDIFAYHGQNLNFSQLFSS